MSPEIIRIGDTVVLDDGTEGKVIEIHGRRISRDGGFDGAFVLRLTDDGELTVAPSRIRAKK